MADGDAFALSDLAGTNLSRVNAQGVQFTRATTVAMADAAHALVIGAAGAAETQLLGNLVFCDSDSSGANEILTLPAEADSEGLTLIVLNTGGEGILLHNGAAGLIATMLTAEHAIVGCDGTTWLGFVGGET